MAITDLWGLFDGSTYESGVLDMFLLTVREQSRSMSTICANGVVSIADSGYPSIPSDFFMNIVDLGGESIKVVFRTAGTYCESYTLTNQTYSGVTKHNVGDEIMLPFQGYGKLRQFMFVKLD